MIPRSPVLRSGDAARRMRDILALHQVALTTDELIAGRYVAIRLADGGSDGQVYDTRADAIRAQANSPSRCLYLRVPLERLNASACDTLLWYVRGCYDSGAREDPAHALMVPNTIEHLR